MRTRVIATILLCSIAAPAFAQQASTGPIPVGTIAAKREPVSKSLDLVGRIEAVARVEIRARVTGYLDEVLFQDGQVVKEGDPLYRLEQPPFEAAVQQAEGSLEQAKAALTLASKQRERASELRGKEFASQVSLDQAIALEEQSKGQILSTQAALNNAKINLGYTEILAPIAGRLGRTSVTKGNVVGPDSGVLTEIVSVDPMYATFPVSQREFLQAQETGKKPDLQSIQVRLRFADGSEYSELGRIDFVAPSVDQSTDTITVRAVIPNPKGQLIHGQLVHVELVSGEPDEKIVVPQSALLADQGGTYVLVVADGKATQRRLKLGGEHGSGIVVEEGLAEGDLVIVEGLQTVRPGQEVQATPMAQSLNPG